MTTKNEINVPCVEAKEAGKTESDTPVMVKSNAIFAETVATGFLEKK